MTIVARTKSDTGAVAGPLRAALTAQDKSLPVYALKPMTEYLRDSLSRQRFNLILLSVFGFGALALAAVGVYGVISCGVAQRTHEIGIRLALGAGRRDVLGLILTQGLKLVLLGVVTGLGAAFALSRWMETLLFGVRPTDPLTFAGIAAVLLMVSLVACWIPARRATRVDPLVSLRSE